MPKILRICQLKRQEILVTFRLIYFAYYVGYVNLLDLKAVQY